MHYIEPAVTLSEYARIIEYDECRFYGVMRNDYLEYQCREFWYAGERKNIAHYLRVAQQKIENVLGYTLTPQWQRDEFVEYRHPIHLNWVKTIGYGVQAEADIELGATVDYTADPATITVTVSAETADDEIAVFFAGTNLQIDIGSVELNTLTNTAVIEIPRCRLVDPAFRHETVDYADDPKFVSTVDVKRIYNDDSQAATILWPDTGLDYKDQTAVFRLRNPATGAVDILPARYADGAWSKASAGCYGRPKFVHVNYYAGLRHGVADDEFRDAIVRLAHSLMPDAPCGCDTVMRLWKRDKTTPIVVDRERLNCPFGLPEGAWFAWKVAHGRRYVAGQGLT